MGRVGHQRRQWDASHSPQVGEEDQRHQQPDAHHDGGVGDVEDGPGAHVQEIDDFPQAQAVEQVAYRAPQLEAQAESQERSRKRAR